ncbi:MerR family transcriptional regulator [Angustibacter sp. McL0619]|uniref:MerR family transcriptional regulator n=1 Tax=Angustibacter sp. McL0619 TaxID=3415676 RepID=UPI003CED1891
MTSSTTPDELLTIGVLARRTGLTTKAIRHYHRVGLLHPAHVDPQTGYRYYTHQQLDIALLVHRLRAVDVPLQEVRECLNSSDLDAVTATLVRHRRRVEARSIRLRGDLHTIDHYLKETPVTQTSGPSQPQQATQPAQPADVHPDTRLDHDVERRLAVALFNDTWRLMENEARTPADDDRMLHTAHASRHHWAGVGTPVNLARGEWLCSRVYAVLGRGEPSLHHAQRELDLCRENAIGDWDLAFAYEALARAHAVSGDALAARAATEQALACGEDIADDEDRAMLLADLETIPGQPRFW